MRHSESESKDAALPRLEAMPPHVLGVRAGRVAAAITGVLARLFFVILASRFFSSYLFGSKVFRQSGLFLLGRVATVMTDCDIQFFPAGPTASQQSPGVAIHSARVRGGHY